MAKPFKPVLLAPLSVSAFYLLFAGFTLVQDPAGAPVWIYWVFLLIVGVTYLALVPVGWLLQFAYRRTGPPPASVTVPFGLLIGFAGAFLADLPNPNFARTAYYGYAIAAGGLWGLSFWWLSRPRRA